MYRSSWAATPRRHGVDEPNGGALPRHHWQPGGPDGYPARQVVTDILQPTHLLFILVVALLVLGPKRLPEVARTLGNGLRDFRSAISGESDERPGQPGHFLADDHDPAPSAPSDVQEPAAQAAPVAPEPPAPLPASPAPLPEPPAPLPASPAAVPEPAAGSAPTAHEPSIEPNARPHEPSTESDTVVHEPSGESVTAVHEPAPTTPPTGPKPPRERAPAPPDDSSGPPQT
jgi:TatA/E family protein of Tat protein translocase